MSNEDSLMYPEPLPDLLDPFFWMSTASLLAELTARVGGGRLEMKDVISVTDKTKEVN